MSYPPPPPPPMQPGASYPAPAPQGAPAPTPATKGGLAVAALVVGIVAFLTGLIVVVGLVMGIVGVILSILALRKGKPAGMGITGLVLSGIAALTNIVVIALIVTLGPAFWTGVRNAAEQSRDEANARNTSAPQDPANGGPKSLAVQNVKTPCYSFDGPAEFINDQRPAQGEDCWTELKLWGETDADGNVVPTGVGAVYGQVSVEPVSVTSSTEWVPSGDIDDMVDYLAKDYIPTLGTVITLKESVTLDGQPANITRVKSDAEFTKTKAMIVAYGPDSYNTSTGAVQLFVIVVVTPYDNGDAVIDAIVSSWKWK